MNNGDYNNIKLEDKPFYSKYYVTNFDEDLNNSKFSFKFNEKFENDDLYCELVDE